MKKILPILVCIAWGLWFGGLIALFLFVTTLFKWNRDTAIKTAPHLFAVFETYQIGLAAVTLLATIGWRAQVKRGLIFLIVLFALATAGAIVSPVFITGKMQNLLAAGKGESEEFKQLHGESMGVYTFDAGCLLVAGLLLPGTLRR